jgi:holo-[acyl-carrier protein] synthase
MILGLGVDLVEVARLERAVARHGEDFLGEFLNPAELDRCRRTRHPLAYSSACFAAKEAFFKALGTGRSGRLRWHDLEMHRSSRGVCSISWTGETTRAVLARGVTRAFLSASLAGGRSGVQQALCMVVLEGRPEEAGRTVR